MAHAQAPLRNPEMYCMAGYWTKLPPLCRGGRGGLLGETCPLIEKGIRTNQAHTTPHHLYPSLYSLAPIYSHVIPPVLANTLRWNGLLQPTGS